MATVAVDSLLIPYQSLLGSGRAAVEGLELSNPGRILQSRQEIGCGSSRDRIPPVRIDLDEWLQDEATFPEARMRDRQVYGGQHEVAVGNQVDINRARPVALL